MPTYQVYPSTDDATMVASGSYFTIRNGSSASSVYTAQPTRLHAQNDNNSGTYNIRRSYLYFDTSGIPDSAVVTGVGISLRAPDIRALDGSFNEFSNVNVWPLTVVPGTFPVGALGISNWPNLDLTTVLGSSPNAYLIGSGVYGADITFNGVGRSYINKSGLTKIAIIANRDQTATPPSTSANLTFEFFSADASAALRPLLSVDWQYPTYHVSQLT